MECKIPPFSEVLEHRAKLFEKQRLQKEAERLKRLEQERLEAERFEKQVQSVVERFVLHAMDLECKPFSMRSLERSVAVKACDHLRTAGWPVEIHKTYLATHASLIEGSRDHYTIIFSRKKTSNRIAKL